MPSDSDKRASPTDPERVPSPRSPLTPTTPSGREVEQYPDSPPSSNQAEDVQKLEKDIRTGEHWLIRIGAAGVIMNVVIALIYFGQLKEMRKATQAATDGVKLGRSSTRLDLRAWLGVEMITGIPDAPVIDQPFDVAVLFRNTGKTPAKNVTTWGISRPKDDDSVPNVMEACGLAKTQGAHAMVAPNATSSLTLHATNGKKLGKGWEAEFARRKLFVFGCVLYEDIFAGQKDWEGHHWLTYCGLFNNATHKFDVCTRNSDTGDGDPPTQ